MKYLILALLVFSFVPASAQATTDSAFAGSSAQENRNLVFDSSDIKIIERADAILADRSKWNKNDDRVCDDDMARGTYSLFCALYKASLDIAGEYIHRRPAMQLVRFVLEKYEQGRVKEHRLMDWNNHPLTTFEEVKKVLKEAHQGVTVHKKN